MVATLTITAAAATSPSRSGSNSSSWKRHPVLASSFDRTVLLPIKRVKKYPKMPFPSKRLKGDESDLMGKCRACVERRKTEGGESIFSLSYQRA